MRWGSGTYAGEFEPAEQHFRQAITRLTTRNPNPRESEPYHNLGLTLRYLAVIRRRMTLQQAAWNHEWQSPAYLALAEIDQLEARGRWPCDTLRIRFEPIPTT